MCRILILDLLDMPMTKSKVRPLLDLLRLYLSPVRCVGVVPYVPYHLKFESIRSVQCIQTVCNVASHAKKMSPLQS